MKILKKTIYIFKKLRLCKFVKSALIFYWWKRIQKNLMKERQRKNYFLVILQDAMKFFQLNKNLKSTMKFILVEKRKKLFVNKYMKVRIKFVENHLKVKEN